MIEVPKVTVTAHAVNRFRQRARDPRASVFELGGEIRTEVISAIKGGRVKPHKLPNYRLYGEKKRNLPDGQMFMYREDKRMAWIVKKDFDGSYVVVTTISPTWADEDAA